MKYKEVWMGLLAIIVMGAFIFDGYFIMSGAVKTADPQLLLLIGSVSGASQTFCGLVLSYYFSSSKSSDEKNSTISSALDKIQSVPSTQTTVNTVTTAPAKEPPK